MRNFVPRSAKKGFVIANRNLADKAFRDESNSAAFHLIKRARAEKIYSAKTPADTIMDSLHLIWWNLNSR